MRALTHVAAIALLLSLSGCAWCVEQCFGPPARPAREPRTTPRPADPCDLLPGSLYRAPGASLYFDVDYVVWTHGNVEEVFDWRCRGGWVQFREGKYDSEAYLRDGGARLEWLRTDYLLERRRDP